MKYRRMYVLFISAVALFAFTLTSLAAWAQAVTPISGVKGKLQKVTSESLEIQSPKGAENVKIKQPLTTYGRESSDLSHVTSQSFVGVTSVKQPDGKEQAKEIHIFPPELKGAGEGSNMMDQASQSRMTNGSVSSTGSRMTNGTVSSGGGSRMTNGTVQKQGGGQTIVVQYQNGSQTINVPPGTEVTQIVPKQQKLEAGDTIYAATEKGPDGTLTTNKVYVISSKSGSK
ncbi:MAG TPA: hypothetical protein VJV96_06910 [Candidatus Angelobacter sp.]|nr:hypothetical protein [Candidatus Angelobacter sp.]